MCVHTRRLRRSSDRRSSPRTRLPSVSVRRANGVAVMPRISATNGPRSANFTRHALHTHTLYLGKIKNCHSLYFSAPLPGKNPKFSQIWRGSAGISRMHSGAKIRYASSACVYTHGGNGVRVFDAVRHEPHRASKARATNHHMTTASRQ